MTASVVWVVFGLLLAMFMGVLMARWVRGARSRERNHVARRAEKRAVALLAREGYELVQEKPSTRFGLEVDGAPFVVEIEADLLVRRRGAGLAIVEVKSGNRAPDLRHGATRRQLLEYALAFGVDEVVLVDMAAEEVRLVSFAFARDRS
jgi:Holliday junction resolvase-like predicted endonuclease